jgi:hypothetical protein
VDVTEKDFPFLYGNCKGNVRGKPTFTKLNKLPMRKIMLFVVRLHYATHISFAVEAIPKAFNFETFPELKNVLLAVECELKHCSVPKVDDDNTLIATGSKAGTKRKQGYAEITKEHMERARAIGGIFSVRLELDDVRTTTEQALLNMKCASDGAIQTIRDNLSSFEFTFEEFVKATSSASALEDLEYVQKKRRKLM